MKKLLSVFFVSTFLLGSIPAALATDYSGEQQFYMKMEWGMFNPDGTPNTADTGPSVSTDLQGDLSFTDSVAEIVRVVAFEDGEDRIETTTNSTRVDFDSSIVRATDGIIFYVTTNFSDTTSPSLYYHTIHEGRDVTLPLEDLLDSGSMEYVIDTDDRYKVFFTLLSEDEVKMLR